MPRQQRTTGKHKTQTQQPAISFSVSPCLSLSLSHFLLFYSVAPLGFVTLIVPKFSCPSKGSHGRDASHLYRYYTFTITCTKLIIIKATAPVRDFTSTGDAWLGQSILQCWISDSDALH